MDETQDKCFFSDLGCDYHQAATLELDQHVRQAAEYLTDSALLAQLSSGDMVAREAKYHSNCLTSLYNRVRAAKSSTEKSRSTEDVKSAVALAELITYMEDVSKEDIAPVFKLADLTKLYTTRINRLGVELNQKVHATRLKERLLAHFQDMQEHKKGRDIYLVFKNDVGSALATACEHDIDSDIMSLVRTARIVRREIFKVRQSFNGSFPDKCQENSVPQLLSTLVSMILEGPSIKSQSNQSPSSACLSIAQLLMYNSVKHTRQDAQQIHTRHCINQETPLPLYVGLMLHAHTRKKELVDTLHGLGISISYDRVSS